MRFELEVLGRLVGADDDGIDLDAEVFQGGHALGDEFLGGIAAVGDEDDAGEALTLELFDRRAEGGEHLRRLAFGLEIVEGSRDLGVTGAVDMRRGVGGILLVVGILFAGE